jgi:hypothetical protein
MADRAPDQKFVSDAHVSSAQEDNCRMAQVLPHRRRQLRPYLLEQIFDADDELVAALRPYFESAHFDAREHFHAQAGIDLHPDAKG